MSALSRADDADDVESQLPTILFQRVLILTVEALLAEGCPAGEDHERRRENAQCEESRQ